MNKKNWKKNGIGRKENVIRRKKGGRHGIVPKK